MDLTCVTRIMYTTIDLVLAYSYNRMNLVYSHVAPSGSQFRNSWQEVEREESLNGLKAVNNVSRILRRAVVQFMPSHCNIEETEEVGTRLIQAYHMVKPKMLIKARYKNKWGKKNTQYIR